MNFLLDSGADAIYLDAGVAHRLGLTTRKGPDGQSAVTTIDTLSAGSLQFYNLDVKVAYVHIETQEGTVVGLLGADFWLRGIVGLNFKAKTVTLYQPYQSLPNPSDIATMPLDITLGIARAQLSIEGISGKFLIDTRHFASIVFPRFFNRLRVKNLATVTGSLETPVQEEEFGDNLERMERFTVYDLDFGNDRIPTPQVLVPWRNDLVTRGCDGIIGRSVLRFYSLYIDYAGRAIYLKLNV